MGRHESDETFAFWICGCTTLEEELEKVPYFPQRVKTKQFSPFSQNVRFRFCQIITDVPSLPTSQLVLFLLHSCIFPAFEKYCCQFATYFFNFGKQIYLFLTSSDNIFTTQ